MSRLLFIILLCCDGSLAQEQAAFRPPQAHDVTRYEAGWNKNPFTRTTLANPSTSSSFAQNLAVASCFGDLAAPTIVIVNTKTHERTRLQRGQPAPNGWRLGVVHLDASRKEVTAEVFHGHERALLKYDSAYVNALAASAATQSKNPAATPGGKTILLPGSQAPKTPALPTGLKLPSPPAASTQSAASPGAVATGAPLRLLLPVPPRPRTAPASPTAPSS